MTKKPQPKTPTTHLLQSHYLIITSLLLLLDKAQLKDEVKDHIRTGFAVIEVIHLNRVYHTGTDDLFKPEYDAFFNCFPDYDKRRALLPIERVIEHIRDCIRGGELVGC